MDKERLSVNQRPRFSPPMHGWSSGGADQRGRQLGNYVLIEPIGSGQFGAVFSAEHLYLKEPAALKLFERFGDDASTLEAFVRAARYLSALEHPNIVRIRDFGVLDKTAYLAMDLIVPGAAIDLLLHQMPLMAGVQLLRQVASALHHAHSAAFVDEEGGHHNAIYHGDVKPANILLSVDRAYVTDFMMPNMQEFRRRSHGHPCFPYYDTRWYGTPMYMAPEQLRGVVNIQTDVFAFGVTAYELLTGQYPWDSEDDFSSRGFEERKPRQPRSVETLNVNVPDAISRLIEQCIALHPGDRPRDFGAIVTELDGALQRAAASTGSASVAARSTEYDVALSFASSERQLAEQIYQRLRERCRVFYDRGEQEKSDLWGADLATQLHEVYSERARYCLVLISKEYVSRAWTNWERRAILQRMVTDGAATYILPVVVDDAKVPGLPTTVATLRLDEEGLDGIVTAVLKKVRTA